MMERTQIYLTREEREALKAMAARRGQTQSEIIREAIDRFIEDEPDAVSVDEALEKSFGIWGNRDDMESLVESLRQEWDERIEPLL